MGASEDPLVLSIAPDAAKVGHTAYLLSPMVNNGTGRAMWGPPQVHSYLLEVEGLLVSFRIAWDSVSVCFCENSGSQ